MRGSIGYWGSEVTGGAVIGFTNEMIAWLDANEPTRRVFVLIDKDRRVIVLPDAEGGHVSSCGTQNGTPFRYVSSDRPDSLSVDALDLVPFALHEVEFEEEDGCLSLQLPPDHELPWPNVREDCGTYEAGVIVKDALQARMISLVAYGQTSFRPEHRMPIRLRRMLPDGAWAECLTTAKTLSGVK